MASGKDKTPDSLPHEAGQALSRAGSRAGKSAGLESAARHDDDFPLLQSSERAPTPAWEGERKDLQRRLQQLELRASAHEADKEEALSRLAFRHQQQQDVLTVKLHEATAPLKSLKAENDALRNQVDKLHRLEARREEARLHETRMTDAVTAQASEKVRLQERQREEDFKAREAHLGEQHRLELERRMAEERFQFEARLSKAVAALAKMEKKLTQRLLSEQEAEFEVRQAGIAEKLLIERDLLHEKDLARHLARFSALQEELQEQQRVCSQLQKDMQLLVEAQAVALQKKVDDLLAELDRLDMSLAAYHAGIGTISLPARELPQYLENPVAYAASKGLITELRYRSWLAHSGNPRCTASTGESKLCEARLIRVDSPTKFVPGQSDRCSRHQASDAAIDNVLRFQ